MLVIKVVKINDFELLMNNVLSNLHNALTVILDRINKGYTKANSHYDIKSLRSLIDKGQVAWSYKEAMIAFSLYQFYKSRVPFGQGIGVIYKPQPKDFNSTNPKKIFIEEDHIIFYFPYNTELTATLRESMNLVWHPKSGSFRVKTSYENIKSALRAVMDHDFEIDDSSLDHANKMADLYNQNIEDSKADGSDFEVKNIQGKLYPYQRAGVKYGLKAERVIIADEMGLGKALAIDSKILTPTGYRIIETIMAGDKVINSSGGTSFVTGVFHQGERDIYKVTFTDRTFIECCDDHLWAVNSPYRIFRGSEFLIKSLRDIRNNMEQSNGSLRHYIPIVDIIEFEKKYVSIDPYLLGLLLGDSGIKYEKEFSILGKESDNKFIPSQYLINDKDIRLSLLQGLMDTNGYVMKDGTIQYTSIFPDLIDGIVFIVQSFGGTARRSQKVEVYNKVCTLTINLPQGIIPFRLSKKVEQMKKYKKHNPSRGIKSIEYVGKKQAICIAVDADDHLYLTNDMIVTHNTVQGLAIVENADAYPCIITTPASLKLNWEKEIKKWISHRSSIVMSTSTKPSELIGKDFIIINYEILYDARITSGNKFKKIPYQSVIFDEAHYVKSKDAQRTNASIKIARKARYRINLTGTPIINRPSDLISQLQILDRLNEFGGWEQFVKRYCSAKKTPFGWDISGASNLEELNEKLRATCFIRREKQDVLKELPLMNRIVVPMEMKPFSSYHELIDSARKSVMRQLGFKDDVSVESLSEKQKEDIRDQLNATVLKSANMIEIDALKLAVAKSKLDNVIAWIKNFLANGEKLVVFAYHKEIQNALLRVFRKAARIISGDSQKEREAQKEMFMTDPDCRLLIGGMGNITSSPAGMGHTLTVSSNLAFVEFGWNSAIHDQSEGRIHRIGQKADIVNIYYLLVEGTIEEEAMKLIEEKRKIVEQSTIGKEMVAVQEITNDLARFLFT
jgi:hypothetical protein